MSEPHPSHPVGPALRDRVVDAVGRHRDLLVDVSRRIWSHPELCFEERHAHDLLCDVLEAQGLATVRHAGDLETAFVATAGHEGPEIAVICEYDALPGIGHACGHNVIAAAGLGAGLAAAALADELGGRVRVLGTPAEEGGGGKVLMMRAGLFDGLDAAMMVHPADRDLRSMTTLAIAALEMSYSGRHSHAAAAPHLGRNALDAAVLGYVNVAALRQHIRPDERVHGIFTESGEQPNIVPSRAGSRWYVRSPDTDGLEALSARVLAALEAGAAATGCECRHHWVDPPYRELVDDATLLERFARHAAGLGRHLLDPQEAGPVVGSTDMGNVSHHVPSIHPMLAVAPHGVSIHTPEFTEHAGGPAGDRAVVDGAAAMALTVVESWLAGASGHPQGGGPTPLLSSP